MPKKAHGFKCLYLFCCLIAPLPFRRAEKAVGTRHRAHYTSSEQLVSNFFSDFSLVLQCLALPLWFWGHKLPLLFSSPTVYWYKSDITWWVVAGGRKCEVCYCILFSHHLGRSQYIHIWYQSFFWLKVSVLHWEGTSICRTLVLEEVQMLGAEKGQLVPFLLSILLFGAGVTLFIVLQEWFFFLTGVLVSLYQFVFKIEFMNKLWGQGGSLLLKYSGEQFYLFAPAKGWWSPCSVIAVIHLKEVRISAGFAMDFGLLTVWGVVKAASENHSWFKYHTAANLF